MLSIGFLSFNRYINICKHKWYSKIFSKQKTYLYCVITWCAGFIVDLPNLIGWGRHSYDINTLSCLWDRRASHSYSLFFPLTTIVIPSICILVFYIRIYLFVRESKKKIFSTKEKDNKIKTHSKTSKLQINVAKGLFSAFALFTLCW